MINGYYSGRRPMMRTHVTLPRLSIEGQIDILVDTGAQVTCILGADVDVLEVPYETLAQPATLHGVGGATVMYREPAILTFRDSENGRLYRYRTDVRIGARTRSGSNLPSLLGQDILQNWSLLHEPATGRLEAIPLTG